MFVRLSSPLLGLMLHKQLQVQVVGVTLLI